MVKAQIVVDFAGKTPQYHARLVLLRLHPMERRVQGPSTILARENDHGGETANGNQEKGQEKETLSARANSQL
jgi:hypothetical protein